MSNNWIARAYRRVDWEIVATLLGLIAFGVFLAWGIPALDASDTKRIEENYAQQKVEFTHRCDLLGGKADMPEHYDWVCIKDGKVVFRD